MKKVFLIALAILCVSAAQAVTINWTIKLGGTNPDNAAQSGFGPGYVGLCYIGGTLESIADADLTVNGSDTDYTLNANGSLANATKVEVAKSSYYKDLGNKQNAQVTLTFSTDIDTTTTDTITFVLFNGWNLNNTTAGYALFTVTNLSDTTTTIDLSETTFEWSKNTVNTYTADASVPEPTALALLALGVAGLALRRRNA